MPARKDPPLTDDERARRIRELAEAAGTSDDPAAFDRALTRVVRGEAERPRNGGQVKPSSGQGRH